MTSTRSTLSAGVLAVAATLALGACGQSGSITGTATDGAPSTPTAGATSTSTGGAASSSESSSDSSSSSSNSSTASPASTTAHVAGKTQAAKAPVTPSTIATADPTSPSLSTVNAKPAVVPVDLTKVKDPTGSPFVGANLSTQSLGAFVEGRTMTFHYTATGMQHLYKTEDTGEIMASPNSQSLRIDFGDDTDPQGADLGAMVCMPHSKLAPFEDKLQPSMHTYAKPGTYTVTMTAYFCGDSGIASKKATQTITVK